MVPTGHSTHRGAPCWFGEVVIPPSLSLAVAVRDGILVPCVIAAAGVKFG